jgi:hypothetical protein
VLTDAVLVVNALLLLGTLLGWATLGEQLAGRRFALVSATFGIFALCFLGGLAGLFRATGWGIVVVGNVLALAALIRARATPGSIPTMGRRLGALLIILGLAYACSRNAVPWAWDEFSHWGTQVEYLGIFGELAAAPHLLIFPDYIPGLSLWRAFFRHHLPGTGMSAAYLADGVLVLSCLHALLGGLKPVNKAIAGLTVLAIWILYFQSLILTLLADAIQAMVLLTALALVALAAPLPLLALVVLVLTAIKHVGLILALAVALYRGLDQRVLRGMTRWRAARDTLVLAGVAFAVHAGWRGFIAHHDLPESFLLDFAGTVLRQGDGGLRALAGTFDAMMASEYPHAALIRPPWAPALALTMPSFLALSGLALLVLLAIDGSERRRDALDLIFATGLIALFFLFLLVVWTLTGSGIDKYSFVRYLSVPLFGLIGYAGWRKLARTSGPSRRPMLSLIAPAVCVAGAVMVGPPAAALLAGDKPGIALHQEYRRIADAIRQHTARDDVIWFLGEPSMHYFIFKSVALPRDLAPQSLPERKKAILDYFNAILRNPALSRGEKARKTEQAGKTFRVPREEIAAALGVPLAELEAYLAPSDPHAASTNPPGGDPMPPWSPTPRDGEAFPDLLCRVDFLFTDRPDQAFWDGNKLHFDDPRNRALYRIERDDQGRCSARLVWASG